MTSSPVSVKDKQSLLQLMLKYSPKLISLNLEEMSTEDSVAIEQVYEALYELKNLRQLKLINGDTLYKYQIDEMMAADTFDQAFFNYDTIDEVTDNPRIDASYDGLGHTFNVKTHIFHKSGKHPSVSEYRGKIFDRVLPNQQCCNQDNAFQLANANDDLLLIDVENIEQKDSLVDSVPEDDENFYYYLGYKIFYADSKWQPLPSISGREKILSYRKLAENTVELKYSKRDSLYYLKFTTDPTGLGIKFEYILSVPKPTLKFKSGSETEDEKTIEQEFKQKLERYIQGIKNFKSEPLTLDATKKYTGKDYLKEITQQKKGACRHRAVVFTILFQTLLRKANAKIIPYTARYVQNECHAFCELVSIDDPKEVLTINLGGAPAQLINSMRLNPFEKKDRPCRHSLVPQLPSTLDQIELTDAASLEKSALIKLENVPIDEANKAQINAAFDNISTEIPIEISKALTLIEDNSPSKILLKTSTPKQSYDVLLSIIEKLEKDGKDCFVAYHPEALLTPTMYIKPDPNSDNGEICYETGGPLYDFLTAARTHENIGYLIILYDTFKAKNIIQFNKIIDEAGRKVDKIALNDCIKVLAIYDVSSTNAYQGADFNSRFTLKLSINVPPTLQELSKPEIDDSNAPIVRIDFYNEPMWQDYLLGHWQMQSDNLSFIKSEFIEHLQQTPNAQFQFYNCPDALELRHQIEKAKSLGFICVNQKKIWFPEEIHLQFKQGYDYLPYMNHVSMRLSEKIDPSHMILLNNDIADEFLGTYIVDQENNRIKIKQGLIERYAHQPLHVFVNDRLSEAVLFKFLKKVQTFNVTVTFCYDNQKHFPEEFFQTFSDNHVSMIVEQDVSESEPKLKMLKLSHQHSIYDSNVIIIQGDDIDVCQYHYQTTISDSNLEKTIIVDISEISSESLFQKMDAKANTQKKQFNFSIIDGLLQTKAYQNFNFILKGHFSQEITNKLSQFLLARLNPLKNTDLRSFVLIPQNSELFGFFPASSLTNVSSLNLNIASLKKTMLINMLGDDVISLPHVNDDDFISSQPFSSLMARLYYFKLNRNENPWQGVNSIPQNNLNKKPFDFEKSPSLTTAFYQTRFNEVQTILQAHSNTFLPQSSYVFLTGLTGIGKTHFIHNIWQKHYPNCHYGLEQLHEFCTDNRAGIKTLIIDEANLIQQEFSIFEGLFERKQQICIDNQIYFLSPQHKVIFIGNPLDYSKDRKLSSLCARHGNACLFHQMPAEVIYHEILQPLFLYLDLANDFHKTLAEHFLLRQQFINFKMGQIIISPRELTAMTLLTLNDAEHTQDTQHLLKKATLAVNTIIKHSVSASVFQDYLNAFEIEPIQMPNASYDLMDDGFLLTPSRVSLMQTITDFVSIRTCRQICFSKQCNCNLPSFNHSFLYDGLNGILIEGEPGIGKSVLVIKTLAKLLKGNEVFLIEASSTPEIKLARLLDAFHQGGIVVMDEINTAGLDERSLNAILSGIDPFTHQRAKVPGFLLIGTMNPPTMSGRQTFGVALERRFLQVKLSPYTTDEMVQILVQKGITHSEAEYMVTLYLCKRLNAMANYTEAICFRDLISMTTELVLCKTTCFKEAARQGLCFYSTKPDINETQSEQQEAEVNTPKPCKRP